MSEITNKENTKIKDLIISLLLFLIHKLSNCYKQLNKNSKIDNPQKFEDFTPVVLEEKEDKYSEIIKYSVENPNTKNIALTGPYGSGKSSILKTFEEKHPENKYLNISLATFDEKEHQLKEIEYCILKQLFYKVEQNKIPESRFKRIVNQKNIEIKSIFIFLWLISLIYFFRPNLLNDITTILKCAFYSEVGNIIYSLYFLFGSIYVLYKTMGFILNFKLTKFSFQDTEIENNNDKKSVNFENEIDEILYFFERNTFNVVFIEDLDRFKNTEIFIKLREINYLINNYDPIKKKRKITFIYAVQDDTFKEDERAKFFDFIIPVIPVINYSNSSTELLENIDILTDEIPQYFIKQVSRYLSDKRTLISINNEYKIYKNLIGKDLDKTKLLAMMIYKNVEPTDFDNLNSQKGYVYTVFKNYNELIKGSLDIIDKKNGKINTKITQSNDEMFKDVKELRSLYIAKFYEKLLNQQDKNIQNIQIGSIQCSIKQLLVDSNFNLFVNLKDIYYYTFDSYYRKYMPTSSQISFKTLESEVGVYTERLEVIENKKSTKINQLKKEKEILESEKQVLKTKKIKDIVTNEYFKECLDTLEKKENIDGKEITTNYKIQNIELIHFLIRYGHIDESYSHYISYFYPGTITKEDNDFLKSFTNNKPLPYNFELKEVKNLFPEILESDFSRKEILNFSLLNYILNEKTTEKQLIHIITLLTTNITNPINFIDEYLTLATEENKKLFLKALCKYWKNPNQNIWEEIVSNFSDDKCIYYLNLLFSTLDLSTIKALNTRKSLSKYISEIKSLSFFINIDDEITAFILETNLKFKNIDNEGSKVIFDFIYEKENYVINEKMIELFINRYKQNDINLELLKTANFTTIKNSGASKLIKYIDLNIEFYIKTVFLKLENNCNESEKIIIELLNDNYEDFEPDLTIEIINKNQTPIQDISKISHPELWNTMLKEDKVVVSWDNLLHYFKEKNRFDDLVNYLNKESNYFKLSDKKINKDFDEEKSKLVIKFIAELIKSEISLFSYKSLITSNTIPYIYPNGENFENVSFEKMKVLILNRIIVLSIKNYTLIKTQFKGLLLSLLETNKVTFIEKVGDYTLDSSIIIKLIDSKIFEDEQIMRIIDHTLESILTENQSISNKVCHILSRNRKTKATTEFLKELITQSQSTEDKVKLFNNYYKEINRNELQSFIEELGKPYSTITEGKTASFPNNDYNIKFLTLLESDKAFISSKNINDNGKTIKANLKTVNRI